MFDFEKLEVYQKAKLLNYEVYKFLKTASIDRDSRQQLRRAAFSIVLNIAEGTGRMSNRDRRHFYIIARASVYECAALFDTLKDFGVLTLETRNRFYIKLDQISRMLYSMIKQCDKGLGGKKLNP